MGCATMPRPSWDEFYLHLADEIAQRSKDPSMKIGAVLVNRNAIISVGYNGIPRWLDDTIPKRSERPLKYLWYEHGERNAIYNAARHGIATLGCTMYTQGVPCADCARACIQAGITRVVAYAQAPTAVPKWGESCAVGREMLDEAGVVVTVTGVDWWATNRSPDDSKT